MKEWIFILIALVSASQYASSESGLQQETEEKQAENITSFPDTTQIFDDGKRSTEDLIWMCVITVGVAALLGAAVSMLMIVANQQDGVHGDYDTEYEDEIDCIDSAEIAVRCSDNGALQHMNVLSM